MESWLTDASWITRWDVRALRSGHISAVRQADTMLAAPQFSFSPARDAECWYLTSRRRRPGGRLRGGRWSVALCTFLLAVS